MSKSTFSTNRLLLSLSVTVGLLSSSSSWSMNDLGMNCDEEKIVVLRFRASQDNRYRVLNGDSTEPDRFRRAMTSLGPNERETSFFILKQRNHANQYTLQVLATGQYLRGRTSIETDDYTVDFINTDEDPCTIFEISGNRGTGYLLRETHLRFGDQHRLYLDTHQEEKGRLWIESYTAEATDAQLPRWDINILTPNLQVTNFRPRGEQTVYIEKEVGLYKKWDTQATPIEVTEAISNETAVTKSQTATWSFENSVSASAFFQCERSFNTASFIETFRNDQVRNVRFTGEQSSMGAEVGFFGRLFGVGINASIQNFSQNERGVVVDNGHRVGNNRNEGGVTVRGENIAAAQVHRNEHSQHFAWSQTMCYTLTVGRIFPPYTTTTLQTVLTKATFNLPFEAEARVAGFRGTNMILTPRVKAHILKMAGYRDLGRLPNNDFFRVAGRFEGTTYLGSHETLREIPLPRPASAPSLGTGKKKKGK